MLEVPMSALSVSRPRFGGFWVLWRTLEFNSSVLCESPSHALASATKTACTRLSSSPVTAASSSSFLKRVLILRRVDEKVFLAQQTASHNHPFLTALVWSVLTQKQYLEIQLKEATNHPSIKPSVVAKHCGQCSGEHLLRLACILRMFHGHRRPCRSVEESFEVVDYSRGAAPNESPESIWFSIVGLLRK